MYEKLWMKRILIPLWVIQLLFAVVLLVTTSISLSGTMYEQDQIESEAQPDEEVDSHILAGLKVSFGIYIAISSLTILFDAVEISLFARKQLRPVVAVVLNGIAALVWLVLFILAIVAFINGGAFVLGLIFLLVVTATYKLKLIYAIIVWRRFRRGRGAYSPAQAEAGVFDASHTAYNPAGPPLNAYRYPSPAPPQNQQFGAAAGYYSKTGVQGGAYQYQYEMQEQQQQQQQQSTGRYA